jgi:hypothetical protein
MAKLITPISIDHPVFDKLVSGKYFHIAGQITPIHW